MKNTEEILQEFPTVFITESGSFDSIHVEYISVENCKFAMQKAKHELLEHLSNRHSDLLGLFKYLKELKELK